MPAPMAGGAVVDHKFMCAPHELNSIIFRQDSDFWTEFTTGGCSQGMACGNHSVVVVLGLVRRAGGQAWQDSEGPTLQLLDRVDNRLPP